MEDLLDCLGDEKASKRIRAFRYPKDAQRVCSPSFQMLERNNSSDSFHYGKRRTDRETSSTMGALL